VTLNGRLLMNAVNSALPLPLATPFSAEISLDAFSAVSTDTLFASLATSSLLAASDWLTSSLSVGGAT